MNCEELRINISAFLEGDLSGEEEKNFGEHVESCSQCSDELEAHRKTWQMLGEWEDVEPSPRFNANFWEAVEKDPEAYSIGKPSWWQQFSGAIASGFTYRVPAWSVAVLLMIAVLAGHFTFPRVEERVVIKEIPKVQVVYQQVPGDLVDALPSSTMTDTDDISLMSDIIRDNAADSQFDDLPVLIDNIDTDSSLNRIDIDFLLDGKKS